MGRELNNQIAAKLQEMAELLQQQGANPFRVRAYQRAAETVAGLGKALTEILQQEGRKGLVALPNIGQGIATAIAELVQTGHWAQLERLRGNLDPVHLFQTVPGIGRELAERIYRVLHIDSLEALETAAYDGRLERVKGIGRRRLAGLRASLASMLGRTRRSRERTAAPGPDVGLILEIDRRYLESTVVGELPRIAPKRFNPERQAWLPILHTEQAGWHFTALYSNSALAHQLHMTRDWVVVYFYDDHHQEGQQTVVSETHGPLIGRRVVRGREAECLHHYQATQPADVAP
ncbi:helix-hairpin-helix domain-containing protein [Sedimenticola hydrogenitrophicus]|uniref:helix-hairpin-helix domain-containing protein n=1 Tax=Sedimenticola hydrogenitrophicus TaxID=2967975 RepID=UPI0021A63855|nr:helix-hairpin-helix domain-containing protein [Sedimenticola hydrogenitrophicus]